jgi:hypothetical protein
MFTQLNNFGQQTLTDKQISGIINCDLLLKASWDKKGDFIPESLIADSDVEIMNGKIVRFAPFEKLSKYIDLEELQDVKFQNLKNKISISGKKIFIPEMEIKTNALNLFLQGTHQFNNDIQYSFRLYLDELLSKKFRKRNKGRDEFGIFEEEQNPRLEVFVMMTGSVENPKFRIDRKAVKNNLADNMKREGQEIKTLLQNDLKGKQREEKKVSFQKSEQYFDIEWEDKQIRGEGG